MAALAAVVVLGVLAGTAGAALPPIDVENLRVGFSGVDKSNLFKVGAWTPVWVQLRAGEEGFTGYLDVVAPDDDGTPTVFRQQVQVQAGQSQRFVSYARPGTRDPEFTVRVLDLNGRRRTPDVNTTNTRTQINPIMADETLLVTLGKPRGVDLIPSVPGFTPGPNAPGSPVTVGGFDSLGGGLPGRWYGYDGASAIILDTNDRDVMKELNTPRGLALEEWVKRGGHLVLSVGGNWQEVKEGVLGPMLPAVPTATSGVPSLAKARLDSPGRRKQITPPDSGEAGHGHEAGGGGRPGEGQQVLLLLGGVAAGPPRRLRVRPGDGRRARRGPEALRRLARPRPILGQGARPPPVADRAVRQRARDDGREPRRAVHPGQQQRPRHRAPPRPRSVPRRQADPVRLGRLLHLPVHPPDRAGRLPVLEEGGQADGADLGHFPADRGDGEPAGLLRGVRGEGQ